MFDKISVVHGVCSFSSLIFSTEFLSNVNVDNTLSLRLAIAYFKSEATSTAHLVCQSFRYNS